MKFEIYSRQNCPYCYKIKQVMEMTGVDFNVFTLNDDFDRKSFIQNLVKVRPFLKLYVMIIN